MNWRPRDFLIWFMIVVTAAVAFTLAAYGLNDLYWQDVYERCTALGGHVEHLRRGFLCLAPDGSSLR